ncbi:cytochrome c oxidase subunit II [Rhodopirellula halodulae]|uniref:cytochrome c oxidase subunit II n=1 Tax=Rhodopirellula halodulae TaxID=2894198 RepID=UPI0028F3F5D5|nr:cytochrome c oxidase subunit II [Rhodopirellula sp. JC737]
MFPANESLAMTFPTLLADLNESFWFPIQGSSFAEEVDWVYDLILYISLAFFIPMMAFMAWCLVKYIKARGTKAESQTSHNTPLELTWSIGPSVLLVWMFVQGSISFLDMRTPPEGSYDVGVQAFKWGWTMDYGNGVFHPELHIVKDEPTKLSMRSTDVIHSLFIPAFRAKKDIVPGRYNYMWFKPTVASEKISDEELAKLKKQSEGATWDYDMHQVTPEGYTFFDLYCTEYCGKNHSEMQTVVVVHETQAELDAWIKANSARGSDVSQEAWGELLYNRRGCAGCHSIDGTKLVGPSFKDLYGSEHPLASGDNVLVDENYVRESIIAPKAKVVAGYQPVMPSYKGQLSDDDIDSIIAFLKSISENAPSEPAAEAESEEESAE